MIKLNYEGYHFISDSDIEYELLEGVTFGASEQYTSDIIFVMLSDFRYEHQEPFVGFLVGANFLKDNIEEYDEYISGMVMAYESSHHLKKKGG